MSETVTDARKDLLRYVLLEAKERRLDADRARQFVASLASSRPESTPMAVVGIACRFPGGESKEEFWDALSEGRESIGEFPSDRLADLLRVDPDAAANVRRGGYLAAIDEFDAEYFGIPPRTAQQIDPYHRVLMHALIEAMDDAGHPRDQLQGTRTGVFVGNDHTHRLITSYLPFLEETDFGGITGSWTGILASRLSYHLNLRGPAQVIDTGCSSSLVALDAAIKAISQGDCDTAFVAGANLFLSPSSIGNETESDGSRVRPFDAAADGTVWSEGVAAVYIKPLDAAQRDRDHIYGVILGSAVNNDGKSNGLTAPNATAQRDLLVQAWSRAKVVPESIEYIEAHGTGTTIGDPIELKGLAAAFAQSTDRRQFCGIGSVKSNIGHSVGAAGLASLIKTLLMIERGVMTPTVNFTAPNPLSDPSGSPVYVVDRTTEWATPIAERRAGVSSFSLSGTNCHVVLAGHEHKRERVAQRENYFLPLSARDEDLLARAASALESRLTANSELAMEDILFTTVQGREHHETRVVVHARDRDGLRSALRSVAESRIDEAVLRRGDDAVVRFDSTSAHGALSRYLAGGDPTAEEFFATDDGRRIPLPPQPLRRTRVWEERSASAPTAVLAGRSAASGSDPKSILADALRRDGDPLTNAMRAVWSGVLGYAHIDESADFFALGGDSITAVKLTQQASAVLGSAISETAILEQPQLADFVRALHQEGNFSPETLSERAAQESVSGGESESIDLPITPQQRSIFTSAQYFHDSVNYNVSGMLLAPEPQNVSALQAALDALIARHPALRTSFHLIDGTPVQRVHATASVQIDRLTLADPETTDEHEAVAAQAMSEWVRPFELTRAPLIRVGYAEFADGTSGVAIDMHHLVTDGMSMGVLFRDLRHLLDSAALPALPDAEQIARDSVFAHTDAAMIEHRGYWRERFSDGVPVLDLNTDFRRPTTLSVDGTQHVRVVEDDMLAALTAWARARGVTLTAVLLAAYHRVLAIASGQEDIVIGMPVTGRTAPGSDDLVGMFVNTVAVRIDTKESDTIADVVSRTGERVREAVAHQSFPLESLAAAVDAPRLAGRRPMFDVYFAHQNIDMALENDGERQVPFHTGTAKFDITLSARPAAGGLALEWEYATALFRAETIELYADRFVHVLRQFIASDASSSRDSLERMDARERDLIRSYAVSPAVELDKRQPEGVFSRFLDMAERDPERDAIVYRGRRTSYGELRERIEILRCGLHARGVMPGDRVAILVGRGPEMMAAMLAVCAAGGVYVPLNTTFPDERLRGILTDSEARLVLCDQDRRDAAERAAPAATAVIDVAECRAAADAPRPAVRETSPADPLYVMYTSGTTGRPKGIVIRQEGILRVVVDAWYAPVHEDDTFLMISDYSFDGSVYDLYGALLNGARVVIAEVETAADVPRLVELIDRECVTTFFITTALFNVLVEHDSQALGAVRRIIFGGETASYPHVQRACLTFTNTTFIHAYGPTETSVFATVTEVDAASSDPLPIGRPLDSTTIRVLDATGAPCPVGVEGELYVGGRGVADGYVNRPELQAEKFVSLPAAPGERLYRTGDLAVLGSDGCFYHRGRIDDQVKVRGFRIEPQEIARSACRAAGVTWAHAAVLARGGATPSLCLWFTGDVDGPTSVELRTHLRRELPDYMVPAFLTKVDEVPLTPNGKVDVAALAAREDVAPTPQPVEVSDVIADSLIDDIRSVWSDCLGVVVHDIDAVFYEAGGDSIKAIQVVAGLRDKGIEIEVADLLGDETIRTLADRFSDRSRSGGASVERVREVVQSTPLGVVTPSPAQQAYLDEEHNSGKLFTQSIRVRVDSSVPATAVRSALEQAVERHEALRTTLTARRTLRLRSTDQLVAPIVIDARADDIDDPIAAVQAAVDEQHGPLIAAGVEDDYIVFAAHHLSVDVVSWTVLLPEIVGTLSGESIDPVATRPIAQWSAEMAEKSARGQRRSELPYWRALAARATHEVELFTRGELRRDETVQGQHMIDGERATALFEAAQEHAGLGRDDVVVLVMARAAAQWGSRSQLLVAREGHGRDALGDAAEVSRTVGWFTTVYPQLVAVTTDAVADAKQLRRDIDELPAHGTGFRPLIQHDDLDDDDRSLLEAMRPQLRVNFLGTQEHSGGASSSVLEVEHLPAEMTVDAHYASDIWIDVVAELRTDALVVEVRLPANDPIAPAFSMALDSAFTEVFDAFASTQARSVIAPADLGADTLADILAGLDLGSAVDASVSNTPTHSASGADNALRNS
ncbi:non-ribosomal peptide synthetase [Microbacterium amylolyticum]|uniref:Amino acid adenylation domain-containing protein n=1 Tax=Microbacterium amylolyticum TaxID=936337 RepID=A0ABS4ZHN0_9MICO|nr:non-ribosomal peptide synthetase [Microbacterium amylolyticum]MBP2436783.1 amino acid adenylation domain-containing protein [Microbacterium amylolyticum]